MCHYCLRLRGNSSHHCCTAKASPGETHEHRWVRDWSDDPPRGVMSDARVRATGEVDPHTGEARVTYMWHGTLHCERCNLEVSIGSLDVFVPDAFLHTCEQCRMVYRDAEPLSEFCSWKCVQQRKDSAIASRIDGILKVAGDESLPSRVRHNARSTIERFAEDPLYGEIVRTRAKQALSRLTS